MSSTIYNKIDRRHKSKGYITPQKTEKYQSNGELLIHTISVHLFTKLPLIVYIYTETYPKTSKYCQHLTSNILYTNVNKLSIYYFTESNNRRHVKTYLDFNDNNTDEGLF